MAVVIRMMRAGAKKRPFYRVVVADSRRQRDGRFIEILGYYDPMAKPFAFKVNEEKVKAWIAEGAQPSTQAASLFRKHNLLAPRQSKPAKPVAEDAKKAPVKRRKPRKVTERKAKNKVARVKKKANPKKPQPKKK